MPYQRLYTPMELHELAMQSDMQERGRRLREHAAKVEGQVLREVWPGHWRYVPVDPPAMQDAA